jgi:hypothetical protein
MSNYRDIQALNQSILKKILYSPAEFKKAQERQNNEESNQDHFVFGTVVDIMLTGSKAEFDEKFIKVSEDIYPSDSIVRVVNGVFEEIVGENPEDTNFFSFDAYSDKILQHCKYQDYYNNLKDETRVNKIITAGVDYFMLLQNSVGKTMVTDIDYAKAVNCVMALKSDEFTKKYSDKNYTKHSSEDLEYLDKVVITFEYENLNFKGELDRVVLDHDRKVITPIDFKTTSKNINGFKYEFWKYRYDFQAAVYRYGLAKQSFIQELMKVGYVMDDFLYIVVEKELNNSPMCFEVTKDIIQIGLAGGKVDNNYYEGFTQAVERYIYAENNNKWQYPKEYYVNNGRMSLL